MTDIDHIHEHAMRVPTRDEDGRYFCVCRCTVKLEADTLKQLADLVGQHWKENTTREG